MKKKKLKLNRRQKLIAEKRYLKLDKAGNPKETVSDLFKRTAKYIGSGERNYTNDDKSVKKYTDEFYQMMAEFKFLSGFTLHDRGKKRLMAACYVLPLEDNLASIYKTLYESVQLHRLGAGIGYDFSPLRPEGTRVSSTGKEASGPVSFMKLYDYSSEIILNRGSMRHAGHMGILRVDHPDIEKFIKAKEDHNELTNFNLSIAITDSFIEAYRNDDDFVLKHEKLKEKKTINAQTLMNKIAESVYKSGEPGVIFIDEINRKNTLPKLRKITATNLCGEQPLLPYEACNLGSLVLPKFYTEEGIDFDELERVARLAVRFLDNTIDLAFYVLPKIEEIVKNGNRKIGLGVMGWADLLAKMQISYDSHEAIKLAKKVMKFIQDVTRDESAKLGKERGDFGNFEKSIFAELGYKNMRNATITTIAPTGTTSLFANCNGGIEPFFAIAYKRKEMETLKGHELDFLNEELTKKLKEEWLFNKDLIKEIAKKGSIQDIEEIPTNIKRIYKTSLEIKPDDHLAMQAAFQQFTDNAVSKTINVSEDISVKEIEDIYLRAYEFGLKGVTIYRNKSREEQVLNI